MMINDVSRQTEKIIWWPALTRHVITWWRQPKTDFIENLKSHKHHDG